MPLRSFVPFTRARTGTHTQTRTRTHKHTHTPFSLPLSHQTFDDTASKPSQRLRPFRKLGSAPKRVDHNRVGTKLQRRRVALCAVCEPVIDFVGDQPAIICGAPAKFAGHPHWNQHHASARGIGVGVWIFWAFWFVSAIHRQRGVGSLVGDLRLGFWVLGFGLRITRNTANPAPRAPAWCRRGWTDWQPARLDKIGLTMTDCDGLGRTGADFDRLWTYWVDWDGLGPGVSGQAGRRRAGGTGGLADRLQSG